MKLLIATLDPTTLTWPSLPAKQKEILAGLNKTPNASWDVRVEYFPNVRPFVNEDGRISHEWFNEFSYPLFRQGNHLVNLHMSMAQWEKYGLDRGIRGANQTDNDFVGESYVRADENTKRGRTRMNQFVQTNLHEASHELARATGVPDKTHEFHLKDKNHDISGIFSTYNMANWQPEYVKGIAEIDRLTKLVAMLQGRVAMKRPLAFHWDKVSQPYGVANSRLYPRTGHHIGVDFATPIGTVIFAPADGEVTGKGFSDTLGHWCEYRVGKQHLIFCHLMQPVLAGTRKSGQIIGLTGNTGMTTGPHLHLELWNQPMNRSILTSDNWMKITSDITKIIK